MRILVFSPHPDDDVIGCGGSIAKHVTQDNEVIIVYMTSGEAGSLGYAKKELAKIREKEAREAAEILGVGVQDLIFLRNRVGNRDGYLEYNEKNLVEIINIIRAKKPNVVYIPHKNDAHKDHMKTNELVVESIGRAGGPWFPECKGEPWLVATVLCYEVWTPLLNCSYASDITDFFELKVKALKKHASQTADIQYVEAVKGLNRYRGMMSGKGKYCECFQVLKTNKI